MSYSSQNRAIQPFKLLGDSFAQVGPVYVPLLLLAIPATVLSIGYYLTLKPEKINGQVMLIPTAASMVLLALNTIVSLFLFGGIFLFAYRYIKQGTRDVSGSLTKGLRVSLTLLLSSIAYGLAVGIGFLLLVIPGIYLSVSLGFFPYAIAAEGRSALDGLKYSMALVKGRWWATLGSCLVMILPFIPIGIISALFGTIFGIFTGSSGSRLASVETYTNVASALLGLFLLPVVHVYTAKLYNRLDETMVRPSFSSEEM
jgi:hypothetical protein